MIRSSSPSSAQHDSVTACEEWSSEAQRLGAAVTPSLDGCQIHINILMNEKEPIKV